MSVILVPELVGLAVQHAHDRALDAGVLAVDVDPGRRSSGAGQVRAQEPRPGHRVYTGARIHIWVRADGDGGGGGDGGNDRDPVGPVPLLAAG